MRALPGIYENLSFEDYLQIEAFNQSSCLQLLKCPARYFFEKQNKKTTSAMEFGRLLHTALLEPLSFNAVVMPAFELQPEFAANASPKSTKKYKELVAEFEKKNQSQTILDQKTYQTFENIKLSLKLYPEINSLLEAPGKAELTLIWNDSSTGLLCKARIDKALTRTNGEAYYLLDLKTTDSAANTDFSYKSGMLGYDVQAAHYLAGAEALGLLEDDAEFLHLVIEREAPHLVACYQLQAKDLERGRGLLRKCMEIYKQCLESDCWPGYPDGIQPLNLTKSAHEWAAKQLEF
jgi:exodeoxyribonuclease VIII